MKDNQRKPLSLLKFAHSKGISPYTFQKYACKDKAKCQKFGVQAGWKAIVSANNTDFLSCIVVPADRANDGLTRQGSISSLQELETNVTHIQAQKYFEETFFKRNVGKMKKSPVKAQ